MAPSGKKDNKPLAEVAKSNPSQLGDPVSLKAEKSNTEPTEKDRGAKGENERKGDGKGSLAEAAMKNPTLLGDPVSMKAEKSDTEVTEDDRGARGTGKKGSKL